MVYVVERYLPGLTRSDLLRGLSRLEQAEWDEARRVRYLGSTIVLDDEACFCQFEGPSEAAVAEANRTAGLGFARIVPAVTVSPTKGDTKMAVSTPAPTTVQIRRSRLVGLIAAVAAVAAAVTWAVASFAVDSGNHAAQVVIEQPRPVTMPASERFLKSISHTAQMQHTAQVLHALGLSPRSRQYVLAMSSLSPLEVAAAFGGPGAVLDALELDPLDRLYVEGITSMTPIEQAAAYGGPGAILDALGLSPKEKRYVMGITSMSLEEQAAAFGR